MKKNKLYSGNYYKPSEVGSTIFELNARTNAMDKDDKQPTTGAA